MRPRRNHPVPIKKRPLLATDGNDEPASAGAAEMLDVAVPTEGRTRGMGGCGSRRAALDNVVAVDIIARRRARECQDLFPILRDKALMLNFDESIAYTCVNGMPPGALVVFCV